MSIIMSALVAKQLPTSSHKTSRNIKQYFDCKLSKGLLHHKPLCNHAYIFYAKYQFKEHGTSDVCTLYAELVACNSLLNMLLYQFKNTKIESLSYRKKTLKLANLFAF